MSPKQWQQGIMTMQPKAGDLTNWANYRGITLLSIVGKVYEGIMAQRIFKGSKATIKSHQSKGVRKISGVRTTCLCSQRRSNTVLAATNRRTVRSWIFGKRIRQ